MPNKNRSNNFFPIINTFFFKWEEYTYARIIVPVVLGQFTRLKGTTVDAGKQKWIKICVATSWTGAQRLSRTGKSTSRVGLLEMPGKLCHDTVTV